MIPLEQIRVLNPRVRNQRQHQEIIDNIGRIGLKRPIAVTRRKQPDGVSQYDLVCGQGRLEAFQSLGYGKIPAVLVEVTESDCLVMSLVENIARRPHKAIDLMREVEALHDRGYTDAQIGEKIGVGSSWANAIVVLLKRGEERLVAAVEAGLIPLGLATMLAKLDDGEGQLALADAYAEGKLRGRKLAIVKQLLVRRANSAKLPAPHSGSRNERKVSSSEMLHVYEREVAKQQILMKKADFAHSRLLFAVEALRDLMQIPAFVDLLRAQGIHTLPRSLSERMVRGDAS
jgi:ParB family chromosome partitioning protein